MMELWPFTNFHDMNLDWIIKRIKNIEDSEAAAADSAQQSFAYMARSERAAQRAEASESNAEHQADLAESNAQSLRNVIDQVNANTSQIDTLVANAGDVSSNAELLSIRTGYDGTTYPTAGDAVRSQVSDLHTDVEQINVSYALDLNLATLWEQGAISTGTGNNANNTSRARTAGYLPNNTGILTTSPTRGFYILAYEVGGGYVGAYKSDGTFVTDGSENGYTEFNIGALALQHPTYRFRIAMYPRGGGGDIDPVTEWSNWTLTNVLNAPYDVKKFKVATYNIGKFAWGGAGGLYTEIPEKIANYKKFIGETSADIFFLQEYTEFIDDQQRYDSDATLFTPVYWEESYWERETAIKSQFPLTGTAFSYIHTSGDPSAWCIYGEANVAGVQVGVASAVLNVTSNENQKKAALNKLCNQILNTYGYAVVGMDTNVLSETEADNIRDYMESQGFKSANWSYFGYQDTYNPYSTMYHAIDNVFVKGNIKVTDAQVPDVYSKLSSDHLPYVVELCIK